MKLSMPKDTKSILMVIAALVLVVGLISWWSSKSKGTSKDYYGMGAGFQGADEDWSPYATFEHYADGGAEGPKVMLFYATWCGHCEKYLSSGIFDKVAGSKDAEGVAFQKFDADKNEELRDKYDVTSFPTILGVNAKGEKIRFEGNRNVEADLISFAHSLKM